MHKRKHASTPIEEDSSHNISDSQKKHYSNLGFKPYRSYSGKVKWLSFEQHVYEKIKYAHARHSHAIRKGHRYNYRKVNYYRLTTRFIKRNWFILLILFLFLLFLIFYQQIIAYLSDLII
jgi:hypothetical protein